MKLLGGQNEGKATTRFESNQLVDLGDQLAGKRGGGRRLRRLENGGYGWGISQPFLLRTAPEVDRMRLSVALLGESG